jgi:hypothetical protein
MGTEWGLGGDSDPSRSSDNRRHDGDSPLGREQASSAMALSPPAAGAGTEAAPRQGRCDGP